MRKLTLVRAPIPQVGGIGNAGSGSTQVSPGGLFSVYGQNLATGTLVASSVPWPTTLGVTSVTVNGIPAPLSFVSAGQINAQLPYEVLNARAHAIVTVNGTASTEAGFEWYPLLRVCWPVGCAETARPWLSIRTAHSTRRLRQPSRAITWWCI